MDVDYYYYHHSDCVGYMKEPLIRFQDQVGSINSLLDIGGAHGHFSRQFRELWPSASVTIVECNDLDLHYYKDEDWNVQNVCLGSKPCKKTFYLDPQDKVGGGSSFYLEDTKSFINPVQVEKEIVTLDSLNLGAHEFIKMDTQGSEIDIIKGGKETIAQADYLLIEMSLREYNKGGCLIGDVIKEVGDLGFRLHSTFGPHEGAHWFDQQQVQLDGLFVKDRSLLKML